MGANTQFASGHALTKKVWGETLFRTTMRSLFFTNWIGASADNIIQMKTELTKQKGDKITFGLRVAMTDRGQTSSTTGIALEGNEVAIVYKDFAVELEEKGNASRTGSKLDLQRPVFDLRTEMKDALGEWATNEIELVMLERLLASPSTNRYVDETGSGFGAMTLETIRRLKRKANMATPKLRPSNGAGGKKAFCLLVHEYAMKGLLADDNFTVIMKDAADRGSKNPLISGADYFVEGVAIYVTDRPEMLSSGGVVTSLFLGAQAGVIAWAQKPEWNEKLHDYNRLPGVAVDMLVAVGKTVFDSEDYGVIAVDNTYVAD